MSRTLLRKYGTRHETQEINEIANLAFVFGRSNWRISATGFSCPAYLGFGHPLRTPSLEMNLAKKPGLRNIKSDPSSVSQN